MHGDPSHHRIAATIGVTMLVWFAWFNVTALTNVRGGIGPRGRPLMFASMAGVGVLALGVEPLLDGHPWLFAVCYVIARTSVWPLWWSGRRGAGALRPLLWGPGVSALWLLTPLVPDHLPGWALAALAFLEMSLSLLRPDSKDSSAPRLSGPHMVERIGLFVMIVLGESVVQIVNSLDTERSALTWVTAACAMALMGALWWLIYEASVEKAEMAVEKADANPLDFVGGSQLGIVAGLVLLAAGVADAIHSANPEHGAAHLHPGSLACLCLGLVHIGTRSLTRQAFVTNLGLPARRRPQTAAEREQMQRERETVRAERAGRAPHEDVPHDPWGAWHAVLGGLTQLATYLVPVIVVWWLGGHWAPWIVIILLFLYVAGAIWVQGYGERRITAYVQTMRATGDGPDMSTGDDAGDDGARASTS